MSTPQQPQDPQGPERRSPPAPPSTGTTDTLTEAARPSPQGRAGRRRGLIALATVVAVLGLAVGGVLYWKAQTTQTANADVGDCVQVTSASRDQAQTRQINCADPQAGYRVTAVGTGVGCDTKENTFSQGDTTVCLRLNLQVGDCAKIRNTPSGSVERTDCAGATADDVRLASLDTAAGSSVVCSDGQLPLVLTSRSITYCFAAAKS